MSRKGGEAKMGKVEKFVKTKEKEKHATTEEFIGLLRWYIEASEKLRQDWIRSMADLNEAFNTRIHELKEKQEENK